MYGYYDADKEDQENEDMYAFMEDECGEKKLSQEEKDNLLRNMSTQSTLELYNRGLISHETMLDLLGYDTLVVDAEQDKINESVDAAFSLDSDALKELLRPKNIRLPKSKITNKPGGYDKSGMKVDFQGIDKYNGNYAEPIEACPRCMSNRIVLNDKSTDKNYAFEFQCSDCDFVGPQTDACESSARAWDMVCDQVYDDRLDDNSNDEQGK